MAANDKVYFQSRLKRSIYLTVAPKKSSTGEMCLHVTLTSRPRLRAFALAPGATLFLDTDKHTLPCWFQTVRNGHTLWSLRFVAVNGGLKPNVTVASSTNMYPDGPVFVFEELTQ